MLDHFRGTWVVSFSKPLSLWNDNGSQPFSSTGLYGLFWNVPSIGQAQCKGTCFDHIPSFPSWFSSASGKGSTLYYKGLEVEVAILKLAQLSFKVTFEWKRVAAIDSWTDVAALWWSERDVLLTTYVYSINPLLRPLLFLWPCIISCAWIILAYLQEMAAHQCKQTLFYGDLKTEHYCSKHRLFVFLTFELNREIPKYVLLLVVHSIQGFVFSIFMKKKEVNWPGL